MAGVMIVGSFTCCTRLFRRGAPTLLHVAVAPHPYKGCNCNRLQGLVVAMLLHPCCMQQMEVLDGREQEVWVVLEVSEAHVAVIA